VSALITAQTFNRKLSRVACIGDSITELTGYPEDLQVLLGHDSVVGNFGVRGATVSFDSVNPYYFDAAFQEALSFQPSTVIIMLGTNDARLDNCTQIKNFTRDYEQIINRILSSNSSKPQFHLVKPPPILENYLNLSNTALIEGVLPRIEQIATKLNLPIIDAYTPFVNHPEYYVDGVHLNIKGAKLIAEKVYQAIK
jgi:lysophospholipase L1-like esterase